MKPSKGVVRSSAPQTAPFTRTHSIPSVCMPPPLAAGLQVSLLSGWQNISELLIQSGASTKNVGEIKGRLTCPDCKRVVAKYNL